MNITEKILFQQDVPNNNKNFGDFLLLFTICYILTRISYSLGGSLLI